MPNHFHNKPTSGLEALEENQGGLDNRMDRGGRNASVAFGVLLIDFTLFLLTKRRGFWVCMSNG